VTTLRKIASSGRAIVCTIHQPSAELFFQFDSLLLLQSGGKQAYYGTIGCRGRSVKGERGAVARYCHERDVCQRMIWFVGPLITEYFEGIDGVPKLPARMNPATWIIDIVSDPSQSESGEPEPVAVVTPAASQIAFHEFYKTSAVFTEARRVIEQASKVTHLLAWACVAVS
jgi:hypothetical protein